MIEPTPEDAASAAEAEPALSAPWRGQVPPLLYAALVRHLEALTPEASLQVRQAAADALGRRVQVLERDGLRTAPRPAAAPVLGLYRTHAARAPLRPYLSLLRALEPLEGSCSCPDFRRASLGLCKHLLAVLIPLARRPRTWERARQQQVPAEGLRWDPVRPLTGEGDWLEQVQWHGATAPPGLTWAAVDGGRWRLLPPPPGAGKRRVAALAALRALLPARPAAARRADPGLAALLEEEQETLARRGALRLPPAQLARHLRTFQRTLYAYQREGLARFLDSGRLLLADDMGLGKTTQAMAACHVLFHAGRVRRGLLVVPASLKAQWQREWKDATDLPLVPVEGPPAERARTYRRTREGFLLAGYEQVLRDLPLLRAARLELVVLDEAQRIKNWQAKTSAAVKQLQPPYRLVLTGTPLENRLEELASLMDWVQPTALEPRWRLAPLHTPTPAAGEAGGARHLGTLRERLAPAFLRRVRREVLSQLPARTDTRIPVALTPEQQEEHEALTPAIAQLVARARRRPLRPPEFLRLMSLLTTQRMICNGLGLLRFSDTWPSVRRSGPPTEALLHSLRSPKLLELRELVASLVVEQERKVVIFSQWRRMLTLAHWAVSDVLAEARLEALSFSGEESLAQRARNVEAFHEDPRARILFATDAGGVGLNLQRAASACVHLELPWNPAVLEQRTGRIWRLGQQRPIDVYSLVSSTGIEARIAAVVSDKRALFNGLFDGTADTVAFERSGAFTERVARLVEPAVLTPAGRAAPLPLEEEEALEPEASAEQPHPQTEPLDAPEQGLPTPTAPQLPSPAQLQELLGSVQVRPTPEGGLVLEAPPQAAAALASLFAGMARLLARG